MFSTGHPLRLQDIYTRVCTGSRKIIIIIVSDKRCKREITALQVEV